MKWAVLHSVAKKNLTSKSFFSILFYIDSGYNKDEAEKQNALFETQTLITFYFTISYLLGTLAGWDFLLLNKQNKHRSLFHLFKYLLTLSYQFGFAM